MNCPEFDQLTAFAYGALTPEEEDAVLSHIADCEDCGSAVGRIASEKEILRDVLIRSEPFKEDMALLVREKARTKKAVFKQLARRDRKTLRRIGFLAVAATILISLGVGVILNILTFSSEDPVPEPGPAASSGETPSQYEPAVAEEGPGTNDTNTVPESAGSPDVTAPEESPPGDTETKNPPESQSDRWLQPADEKGDIAASVLSAHGRVLLVHAGSGSVETLYGKERALVFVGDVIRTNSGRLSLSIPGFGRVDADEDTAISFIEPGTGADIRLGQGEIEVFLNDKIINLTVETTAGKAVFKGGCGSIAFRDGIATFAVGEGTGAASNYYGTASLGKGQATIFAEKAPPALPRRYPAEGTETGLPDGHSRLAARSGGRVFEPVSRKVIVDIGFGIAVTSVEESYYYDDSAGQLLRYEYKPPANVRITGFATGDAKGLADSPFSTMHWTQIGDSGTRTTLSPGPISDWAESDPFTAEFFADRADSLVRIRVSYAQVLDLSRGTAYRFRQGTPETALEFRFDVSVDAGSFSSIPVSPANSLKFTEKDGRYRAGLGTNGIPPAEIVLSLGRPRTQAAISPGRDGRFAFTAVVDTGGEYEPPVLPRDADYLLLVDSSGSIDAYEFLAQYGFVREMLSMVPSGCRFNVCRYNSDSELFAPEPIQVSAENRALALHFVWNSRTEGGTDLEQLLKAVSAELHPDRKTVIILSSDGAPTVGELDKASIIGEFASTLRDKDIELYGLAVGLQANRAVFEELREVFPGGFAVLTPRVGFAQDAREAAAALLTPRPGPPGLVFSGRVPDCAVHRADNLRSGQIALIAGEIEAVDAPGRPRFRLPDGTFRDVPVRADSTGEELVVLAAGLLAIETAEFDPDPEQRRLRLIELGARYRIASSYATFIPDGVNIALTKGFAWPDFEGIGIAPAMTEALCRRRAAASAGSTPFPVNWRDSVEGFLNQLLPRLKDKDPLGYRRNLPFLSEARKRRTGWRMIAAGPRESAAPRRNVGYRRHIAEEGAPKRRSSNIGMVFADAYKSRLSNLLQSQETNEQTLPGRRESAREFPWPELLDEIGGGLQADATYGIHLRNSSRFSAKALFAHVASSIYTPFEPASENEDRAILERIFRLLGNAPPDPAAETQGKCHISVEAAIGGKLYRTKKIDGVDYASLYRSYGPKPSLFEVVESRGEDVICRLVAGEEPDVSTILTPATVEYVLASYPAADAEPAVHKLSDCDAMELLGKLEPPQEAVGRVTFVSGTGSTVAFDYRRQAGEIIVAGRDTTLRYHNGQLSKYMALSDIVVLFKELPLMQLAVLSPDLALVDFEALRMNYTFSAGAGNGWRKLSAQPAGNAGFSFSLYIDAESGNPFRFEASGENGLIAKAEIFRNSRNNAVSEVTWTTPDDVPMFKARYGPAAGAVPLAPPVSGIEIEWPLECAAFYAEKISSARRDASLAVEFALAALSDGNRISEAISALDSIIANMGGNADLSYLRGILLYARGDTTAAIAVLRRASDTVAGRDDIDLALARVLASANDDIEAYKTYSKLFNRAVKGELSRETDAFAVLSEYLSFMHARGRVREAYFRLKTAVSSGSPSAPVATAAAVYALAAGEGTEEAKKLLLPAGSGPDASGLIALLSGPRTVVDAGFFRIGELLAGGRVAEAAYAAVALKRSAHGGTVDAGARCILAGLRGRFGDVQDAVSELDALHRMYPYSPDTFAMTWDVAEAISLREPETGRVVLAEAAAAHPYRSALTAAKLEFAAGRAYQAFDLLADAYIKSIRQGKTTWDPSLAGMLEDNPASPSFLSRIVATAEREGGVPAIALAAAYTRASGNYEKAAGLLRSLIDSDSVSRDAILSALIENYVAATHRADLPEDKAESAGRALFYLDCFLAHTEEKNLPARARTARYVDAAVIAASAGKKAEGIKYLNIVARDENPTWHGAELAGDVVAAYIACEAYWEAVSFAARAFEELPPGRKAEALLDAAELFPMEDGLDGGLEHKALLLAAALASAPGDGGLRNRIAERISDIALGETDGTARENLYQKMLYIAGDAPEIERELGLLYLDSKPQKSVEIFGSLTERAGQDLRYHLDLAAALAAAGLNGQLAREYRLLADNDVDRDRIDGLLGRLLLARRENSDAVRLLTSAAERSPESGLVRRLTARTLEEAGLADLALREYRAAFRVEPDSPASAESLFNAYIRLDRAEERADFASAIRKSTDAGLAAVKGRIEFTETCEVLDALATRPDSFASGEAETAVEALLGVPISELGAAAIVAWHTENADIDIAAIPGGAAGLKNVKAPIDNLAGPALEAVAVPSGWSGEIEIRIARFSSVGPVNVTVWTASGTGDNPLSLQWRRRDITLSDSEPTVSIFVVPK